jgi:hypothetical protein
VRKNNTWLCHSLQIELKWHNISSRRCWLLAAGCEHVPASTRLGGGLELEVEDNNSEVTYSIGIGDSTEINEQEENNLCKCKWDAHEDEHLDINISLVKQLAAINSRFTKVAYTDASFAVGETTKQSVSGFVVSLLINGVPILWGSLKQTIVVDST